MNTRLVSMAFAAFLLLYSAVSFAGEYEDGGAAYIRGEYKTALAMFTRAANKGDASAQIMLGLMYANGQGVAQDYNQAVLWYQKAADQGNAPAQNSLGLAYATGRGVTQDYKQAVAWYRKAAEQGFAPAQFSLGLMYEQGRGVTQDYVEAHKWFNIAAAYSTETTQASERILARYLRDAIAKRMTPAQIAEAEKRANEWKNK